MAACYAVENSLGFEADPTVRARLIRNIVLGFEYLMSHIVHFYALAALDYIQGPAGGPGGTGNSPLPKQSGPWSPYYDGSYYHPLLLEASFNLLNAGPTHTVWGDIILDYVLALQMQRRAAEVMGVFGARWPMFSNIVCGGVSHPYLDRTNPETGNVNLTDFMNLAEGILYKGINGQPDFEGGTQTGNGGRGALMLEPVPEQGTLLHFIQQHLIPDVQAVAAIYSNYDNPANLGLQTPIGTWPGGVFPGQNMGIGYENFLSYGVFHDDASEVAGDLTLHPGHLLKAGVVLGGGLSRFENPMDIVKHDVNEYIDSSWYDDDPAVPANAHPRRVNQGYTRPNRDNKPAAYSWIKSPRIDTDGYNQPLPHPPDAPPAGVYPVEVGPLARMIISGLYDAVGIGGPVNVPVAPFGTCPNRPAIGPAANPGTLANILWVVSGCSPVQTFGRAAMDRHRARALEALTVANALAGCTNDGTSWDYPGADGGWLAALAATPANSPTVNKSWNPPQDEEREGWGTNEAPRGALLHYMQYGAVVDPDPNDPNGKRGANYNRITKYQCVVPTTWNANPYAPGGKGPIEKALLGTYLAGVTSQSGRAVPPATNQYVAVEALRVAHSFDPCIACAVHKVEGKKVKAKKLNTKKEVRRR